MREDRLDPRDRAIINALRRDGRIPYTELGKLVGISGTAAAERVARLIDVGVIAGFHAAVRQEALGFPITAFVEFSPFQCGHDATLSRLRQRPEIEHTFVIAGEVFAVLLVRVKSIEMLSQFLREMSVWGKATSMLVLESWNHADQDI